MHYLALISATILVTFSVAGCSQNGPRPVPPPPAAETAARPVAFPDSHILKRLADAGAWITPDRRGIGPCEPLQSIVVEFRDQPVLKESVLDVARLEKPAYLNFVRAKVSAATLALLNGSQNLYGLRFDTAADSQLCQLLTLPNLREFCASGAEVTGQSLNVLRFAPHLCRLRLGRTRVDDRLLSGLKQNRHLHVLDLSDTMISDAGIKCLDEMRAIEDLNLSGCAIGDSCLAHLNRLPKLRYLRLSRTCVSDDGLKDLAQLKALEVLSLDGTSITDAGLRAFAVATTLSVLDVSDTALTNRATEEVAKIPNLTMIFARETAISGVRARAGQKFILDSEDGKTRK